MSLADAQNAGKHRALANWLRAALIVSLGAMTAACFQPLYGERSLTGGPGLGQALAGVDVMPIDAPQGSRESRLAVEVRNALLFGLTRGGAEPPPTHRLKINMTTQRTSVIVDVQTARPEVQNYGINAQYILTEIATGKPVVTGSAFSRVAFDVPGQQQRFAQVRALRDAENRAATVLSEQIKSRVASFFAAGT